MKIKPLRVLIIVTIFIIVIAVSCGVFIYYDINERKEITIDVYKNRESLINKENTLIKIKSNYNSTVKTIRDSKLYIKDNGKYKESGKINKGNTLELESLSNISLNNKYFKILNSNYYISYKDIVVVEKSTDNGVSFNNILENDEKYLTINREADVTFVSEDIGFIFDLGLLGRDDRYKKFLVTTDGGKTFSDVSITINGYGDLDYYYINNMPYLKEEKLVLDVSVPDGNDLKDIELISNDDGLTFSN